jgi:hypothetical protein
MRKLARALSLSRVFILNPAPFQPCPPNCEIRIQQKPRYGASVNTPCMSTLCTADCQQLHTYTYTPTASANPRLGPAVPSDRTSKHTSRPVPPPPTALLKPRFAPTPLSLCLPFRPQPISCPPMYFSAPNGKTGIFPLSAYVVRNARPRCFLLLPFFMRRLSTRASCARVDRALLCFACSAAAPRFLVWSVPLLASWQLA